MEHWINFAKEHWLILAAAFVILLIIVRIVKTVLKWVVVLAVLAAVVFYGFQYKDKLSLNVGQTISQTVTDELKKQALDIVAGEAKDAKFASSKDGSYSVTSKNIIIEGKAGQSDVKVTFHGQSFHMNANAAITAMIEQAKKNGN